MADIPLRVYLIKHLVPMEGDDVFFDPLEGTWNPTAIRNSNWFATWLEEQVSFQGMFIRGFSQEVDGGIESHYLVCLINASLGFESGEYLDVQLAEGNIFVGNDGVYYATQGTLTKLEGEALTDWYEDEHRRVIPDLDADIRLRLARSCRLECQSLGFSGMALRELTPRWIDAVCGRQPAAWDWRWFGETLKQVVQDFETRTKSDYDRWFVYEALEPDGDSEPFPPVENGKLILEVIEALVDEPNEARQWLVRARPVYAYSQVRFPEFETIRPLEKNEIFTSHRGVFWNGGRRGIMLGEVGGDLLHERHGDIVENVEDQIREFIIDSLASGIEGRSGCDDFSLIIQAIDDEIKKLDPLQLWHHDLASLMDRVIDELRTCI